MREKLTELLIQAILKCANRECKDCKYKGLLNCDSVLAADYLIENGVVIADDVVSKELYKQVRWERDVALKQLERIGVSLGEKTDNIVSVVRCGECKHYDAYYETCEHHSKIVRYDEEESFFVSMNKHDFCSYGEPKESEEE